MTSPAPRSSCSPLWLLPMPILGMALFPSAAHAQGETGFLRGEGRTDVVLAVTVDQYDEFWVGDDRVEAPPVGEVERTSGVLYVAHGLRDDLDLVLGAAWVQSESDGTAGFPDEEDLQDLLLAAKWRARAWELGGGELSLLAMPGIKLPMTDYEDNAVTAIGDGQVDLRGRVIAHYQTERGLFASLETGYDRRNGAPSDEIPIHVTLGGSIGDVTVTPFYSHIESRGGTDIGGGPFRSNEEEFDRAGVGLYWRVSDAFGLTGGWRTTLDGKNTGDVDGFSLGIVVRL